MGLDFKPYSKTDREGTGKGNQGTFRRPFRGTVAGPASAPLRDPGAAVGTVGFRTCQSISDRPAAAAGHRGVWCLCAVVF